MQNPDDTGKFDDGVEWRVWLGGTIQTVWCDLHGGIAVIDFRAFTLAIKDAILARHNTLHERGGKHETGTQAKKQRKPVPHDSVGQPQKRTQEGQDEG